MFKGRRFSDRVYCVDPAIMGFLWGYHDHISDELRQRDLYRVAGVVLDTYRGAELAARRAEMCRIWALQAQAVSRWRSPWPLRFRRRHELDHLLFDCELAGIAAARLARVDHAWHSWTLRFVDMLVWLGSEDDEVPSFAPVFPTVAVEPGGVKRKDEIAPQRAAAALVAVGSAGS